MSRQTLQIRLTTHSPLLVTPRPGGTGEIDTALDHIPGRTLRGALAARFLAGRPLERLPAAPQEVFRDLFLRGRVRYGPLSPGGVVGTGLPVPQTTWTCKQHPWPEPDNHGLRDLVAPLLPGLLGKRGMDDLREVSCPLCGERLDRPEPHFALLDRLDAPSRIAPLQLRRRLIMRTVVESERQTAGAGRLYSLLAIETGTIFTGAIVADADLGPAVQELLDGGRPLAMGGDRTRGLGQVELRILEEPKPWPALAKRLEGLNEHLRAQPDAGAVPAETTFVPLTLTSEAILLDDDLLPAAPTPAVLARYHALADLEGTIPAELKLVAQWQAPTTVGGWDLQLGLPRPREPGYGPGSVWVYGLPGPPDAATLRWLEAIEREGLGERCAEGYGGVIVAHPLHLQAGEYLR